MSNIDKNIYLTALKAAYSKKLDFANFLHSIEQNIEHNISKGKKRFKLLLDKFDEEFPIGSAIRSASEALIWVLLESPLELYFVGNNSAVFIELHALLERFSINELPKVLSKDEKAEEVLVEVFGRKNLIEIAEYLEQLEIWDKSDVEFARKLSKIRNGIAHKNPELISKILSNGTDSTIYSIHEITKKVDCIPYIINSVKLIIKTTDVLARRKINNPKFDARLRVYSSLISRIFNLFMEPDIQGLVEPVRRLLISKIISEALLLSSEELGNLLIAYKELVIDFQEVLGKDENKSLELHNQLFAMCEDIFYRMRQDLGIDNNDALKRPDFHQMNKQ